MNKPTRNKREQMESRPRNYIEEESDADQLEQPTEQDIQSGEGSDQTDGDQPDEGEGSGDGEGAES